MWLFEKVFKRNVRKFIVNRYKIYGFQRDLIHSSSLDGITHSIYKILYKFGNNKKYIMLNNESYLDGYHIDSKNIKILKKNQIYKFLEFQGIELFKKSINSTYHVNNSKNDNNGYTHWYKFSNELQEIIKTTEEELLNNIRNEKQSNNLIENNIIQLKKLEISKLNDLLNNDNEYLKFSKETLINEYELSKECNSKYFDKIMRCLLYWDNNYIYIDNITKDIQNFSDIIKEKNKMVLEIVSNQSKLIKSLL